MDLINLLTPILAADPTEAVQVAAENAKLLKPLAAIGAALIIMGAARGIGVIGERACESIGRQPEAGGAIQTAMIISAALIEGATFFALVICLLALG